MFYICTWHHHHSRTRPRAAWKSKNELAASEATMYVLITLFDKAFVAKAFSDALFTRATLAHMLTTNCRDQKTFWLGVASNWHCEWDLAVNPVKSRTFKMAILCTHLTCYFRTINLCCFNKWLSKISCLCSWLNQQKYFSTNIFPVFGSCSCWARSPDIYLEYKCSAKSDREAMYTSVNNTFYIFHRADL